MAKTIEELEKEYKESERISIQLEERLKNSRLQYKEVIEQLNELGIKSEDDLKKMQNKLSNMMKEVEELLPTKAIEEYKKLEI